LKIGFVVTPDRFNYEPFKNHPLTALYLLTLLEQHFVDRVDVSLIDLRGIEEKNVPYHLPQQDLYLYSVVTPYFAETRGIVDLIREIYPRARHVAGGVHVNLFPEECSEVFDALVLGEGESAIIEVVTDALGSGIKPTYRQGKPVTLDDYPYPNRKYLNKAAVVLPGILFNDPMHLKGTSVLFSRGCPFNCHFCANKGVRPGPVRFRSPPLMMDEIEYLKQEYGVEALAIKDENVIPLNTRIARPYLEALAKSDIKWRGQTRANGVHPDMVKLAKEAGCHSLALGIESADEKVLRMMNKQLDLVEAKGFIRLLRETGIDIRIHLILGLPGETDDIVQKTQDFIDEANPSSVLLHLFCPMPGSRIFHHPEQFGIEIDSLRWNEYLCVFGRFEDIEVPHMIFRYREGRGMSNDRIVENYLRLQSMLRDRKLNC
jgi:anaerobic magnesium-protoporphyrin IX monomethyl ester cyclase